MKVIQYIKKPIDPDYQECMDQLIPRLPEGVQYELYTETPYDLKNFNDYRFNSDLVRLRLAVNNPDMVWVDADTKLLKWFNPLPDGKPWFYGNRGIADICVFYVNGCTEYFKWMLDQFDKLKRPVFTGWAQGLMNNTDHSRYRLIPPGHFLHLGLSALNKDLNKEPYHG